MFNSLQARYIKLRPIGPKVGERRSAQPNSFRRLWFLVLLLLPMSQIAYRSKHFYSRCCNYSLDVRSMLNVCALYPCRNYNDDDDDNDDNYHYNAHNYNYNIADPVYVHSVAIL